MQVLLVKSVLKNNGFLPVAIVNSLISTAERMVMLNSLASLEDLCLILSVSSWFKAKKKSTVGISASILGLSF